jgi:hypothetical protein
MSYTAPKEKHMQSSVVFDHAGQYLLDGETGTAYHINRISYSGCAETAEVELCTIGKTITLGAIRELGYSWYIPGFRLIDKAEILEALRG